MWLLNNLTNYWFPLYGPDDGTGAAADDGQGGDPAAGAAAAAAAVDASQSQPDQGVSWRDFITDDRLKPTAEKYTSLDDFVVAYNRMGGELRSRVRVPGEGATDEDIAGYRKAIGVPQDASGYEVGVVDGYDYTDEDLAVIEDMKGWALDNNIPAPAFDALVKDWVGRTQAIKEQYARIIEEAADDAQMELVTQWGPDYDANIANCARAATHFGGDDFLEFLDSMILEGYGKLGDHPTMVKFLANIGRRTLDEGEIMLQSSQQERQGAQERINQLMAEYPPGSPGYTDPSVQAELQELFKITSGNKPIAGAPT